MSETSMPILLSGIHQSVNSFLFPLGQLSKGQGLAKCVSLRKFLNTSVRITISKLYTLSGYFTCALFPIIICCKWNYLFAMPLCLIRRNKESLVSNPCL